MVDSRRKGTIVVEPGQPPKEAELIEIIKAEEKWSVYELDDGTQVRLRTTVNEIWRVIGEYDPEGNPKYAVKAAGSMSVISPDSLKKGGNAK